ncbi:MAG: NfeD family protein [Opitutales bacterium]|nr:NfeD family protein [Opitutales bacterium]
MIWLLAYLLIGAGVYFYMVLKYSDEPDDLLLPMLLLLTFEGWIAWLLWPFSVWLWKKDAMRVRLQKLEAARARREVKKNPLIGAFGTALTPMTPSGKVLIEETEFPATAQYGFIPKGERVEVVSTRMSFLVVRKAEPQPK